MSRSSPPRVRRPRGLPPVKPLMPVGFTPTEQIKRGGVPVRPAGWGAGHYPGRLPHQLLRKIMSRSSPPRVRRPRGLPPVKPLMPVGFTPTEQIKRGGVPVRPAGWGAGHHPGRLPHQLLRKIMSSAAPGLFPGRRLCFSGCGGFVFLGAAALFFWASCQKTHRRSIIINWIYLTRR